MKKKITIFCQASADVIYTLGLYERYKNEAEISIICVNVKGLYFYLKSLRLSVSSIHFIPYDIAFRQVIHFIKVRLQLNKIYHNLFEKKTNETIYFFALWYDWVTFYFLKRLKRKNKVVYLKHYLHVSEDGRKQYNLKERINLFQYFLLTGIRFQYAENEKTKGLLFPYKEFGIEKKVAQKPESYLIKKYLYKLTKTEKKSILFFEAGKGGFKIIKDYEKTLLSLLKKLKYMGFKVYLKPHPKQGYSDVVNEVIQYFIPQEIPSELIDETCFDFVIGIYSYSLVHFSERSNNVYSIIDLFKFKDLNMKKNYVEYLNVNSKNKIKFIKNINELCLLKG